MTEKLTTAQRAGAYLAKDTAFADWFVDDWMEKELRDFKYRQKPEMLKEMVLSGRGYARHFGIDDVQSQLDFITLMWTMGPGFFLHPGFREIVTNASLTGAQKMDAIHNVPEDLAVDAMMAEDRSLWFDCPLPEMGGGHAPAH